MENTLEKISALIASQLGIDKASVTADKEIIKDFGADSLDIVEMLMGLEEEYGITISEDEAASIKTVGDIVALIEKNAK